jgi:hypothetical protein
VSWLALHENCKRMHQAALSGNNRRLIEISGLA